MKGVAVRAGLATCARTAHAPSNDHRPLTPMGPFKSLAPVALTVDKARAEAPGAKPGASTWALAACAPARHQPRHRCGHYRSAPSSKRRMHRQSVGLAFDPTSPLPSAAGKQRRLPEQRLAKLSTPGQKHLCTEAQRQARNPYQADFSQRTHLTAARATDKHGGSAGPNQP